MQPSIVRTTELHARRDSRTAVMLLLGLLAHLLLMVTPLHAAMLGAGSDRSHPEPVAWQHAPSAQAESFLEGPAHGATAPWSGSPRLGRLAISCRSPWR